MWTATNDGSIVDEDGKVIFFSTERFIRDICLGNCCYICGAQPHEREFNNEHILPDWILRRYDLFSKSITLPNLETIRYDRYTIPCCKVCNSFMGDIFEVPISEAARRGAESVNEFIANGNGLKIFVWLGLIYLKTHLKDRGLRVQLDARKGNKRIADQYEWEYLHHLHCVIRCFYTGSAPYLQRWYSCRISSNAASRVV